MNYAFGVAATILCNFSFPDVEDTEIVNTLLSGFGCNSKSSDSTSAYKKCSALLPANVRKNARNFLFDEDKLYSVAENYKKTLRSLINIDNSADTIVQALKCFLEESENVEASIAGYPRAVVFSRYGYDPYLFIAVAVLYGAGFTENKDGKASLKVLSEDYYRELQEVAFSSKHYTPTVGSESVLGSSLLIDCRFEDVFAEIPLDRTSDKEANLRLYTLRYVDNEIDYTDLNLFLQRIIGSYVFNRVEHQKYTDNGGATLGMKVEKAIKNEALFCGDDDERKSQLGEILVYAFLEHVLKAYKLFSFIEAKKIHGQEKVRSHGAHLLELPNGESQLVIGVASIKDDLTDAITLAISEMAYIKDHRNEYRRIASPDSQPHRLFDPSTQSWLESRYSYSNIHKSFKNHSYGVFVGFSIPKGTDDSNYENIISKKVHMAIPSILDAIDANGLKRFPLYVYFLPFTNAEDDEFRIIEETFYE